MKNVVEEIVVSFSRQELREFKYFLMSGSNAAQQREDIKLLDRIRKGEETRLKNVNAHHQTKKRLKKLLEEFTILENLGHDDSSKTYALMETAKYLFRKNLHKQAWDYLMKAEQSAIQAEDYRLLDYNYDLQITYSYNIATPPPQGFSVLQLLQKWEDNRSFAGIDSSANAAYAFLVYQLREEFSQQLSINIDELTENILERYGLNEMVYDNNLKIYSRIVSLVCRALREKREYVSMKIYATGIYNSLKRKKELDKVSPDFLIDLLDAICVATLRSRDYVNCEKFTNLYAVQAKKMQAHPSEFSYYDFIPYIGVSDLCQCTNRLGEAKQSMLALKKKYAGYTESVRLSFLLRINLLAVHFACGEYETCIKTYNEIQRLNDKKILSEPGFRLELILFTEIYGILFHYEDGDTEYALYLLHKFKRKYASLLKHPDSKREKLFIKIVEQMLSNSAYIKSNKFMAEAELCIHLKEFIAGDFEYISMAAWLQSKLKGKSYYECFIDLVK